MIEVKKEQNGSELCVTLNGFLDTPAAGVLSEEMNGVYDGLTKLTFDFKGLEYLTSSGLRVLLAAQQAGLPLYEYTPMEIKLSVTGNGHADKQMVQGMVRMLLGLKSVPKPDDAADALAAALCHGGMMGVSAEEYRIK